VNWSDLIRELTKVLDAAEVVEEYFDHQTKMNARLHLAEPRPAPLVQAHHNATTDLKNLIARLEEEKANGGN
jgi:hypothetical protein